MPYAQVYLEMDFFHIHHTRVCEVARIIHPQHLRLLVLSVWVNINKNDSLKKWGLGEELNKPE